MQSPHLLDVLWEQLAAIHPVEWVGMFAGMTGVWLSIKERVGAWPLFILCYLAYIFIGFRSGYYAFGIMNVGFIGVAVYGWRQWAGSTKSARDAGSSLEISKIPSWHWWLIVPGITAFTFGIGILLAKTGEARLPYYDAFAVSNALIAQWLLSRKRIENWIFWIISDCVYIGLFWNDQLWPSVILFSVFIVLACKGWHEWRQSMLCRAKNSVD